MLQKMGWSEGSGLGTNGEGIVDHVKVHLKADTMGIGADKRNVDNWLDNSSAFDALLQNLNASNATPSASASVEDEEEPSSELKSAKANKKDKKDKKKKKKKAEADEVIVQQDTHSEKEIPKTLQTGRL